MPVTTSSPKYCFTWIHLWRDAADVRLEATLKVSGCELWCAIVSRVRCGSRAAAKLPWLQVVADAVRLRLARRCMKLVLVCGWAASLCGVAVRLRGVALLLGGVIVWRRYTAAVAAAASL